MKRRLGFAVRMGQRILRPAAITAMGLMVLLLSTTVFAATALPPTPLATVTMNGLGIYQSGLPGASISGSISSSVSSVSLVESYGSATFQRNVSMKMRHFQQIFSVPRHRSQATAC